MNVDEQLLVEIEMGYARKLSSAFIAQAIRKSDLIVRYSTDVGNAKYLTLAWTTHCIILAHARQLAQNVNLETPFT